MEEENTRSIEKLYAIGTFAKLTGVTERTLRFYDRKGLLKPSSKNEFGHRFYSNQDILQLQKIAVLKYLDFSLEEIDHNLRNHKEDFRQTLDSQHELLLRKKKQLDQVLESIEYMKNIMKDSDTIDTQLLILLLYSLQNEGKQKEWLENQLPSTIVDVIFMKSMSKAERLAIEKEIIAKMIELKRLYSDGYSPQDAMVKEESQRLIAIYTELFGAMMETLNEEELAMFEKLKSNQNNVNPVLFPNFFEPKEEAFFKEVFAEVDLFDTTIKGNVDPLS